MIETIYQYSQFMLLDTRTRHDTELLQAAYETIEALRRVARDTMIRAGEDYLYDDGNAEQPVPARFREWLVDYCPALAHIEQHAPWLLEGVMTTRPNNSNLTKAKREKNDEFYTQLTDIEKELRHYPDAFRDKVVLCNCDDQLESNFVKYFKTHFDELGLRGLLVNGYNRETGDGDFRSKECIELLKQADIVVTNPPFSLFREYVAQLVQYDKQFLIIGNMNAITYKEIFPLIKDGKIWLGVTHPKVFLRPDGSKKQVNACWFTNLDHGKRHEFLKLYKRYSKKEYQKYDNYNAIEVSKVKLIPMDYAGIMGVPITFLDKWNPDQFEIVGEMVTTTVDAYNHGYPYVEGKKTYARILIRNKKPEA